MTFEASKQPAPAGKVVLRLLAAPERSEPDAFDDNDAFRRSLLDPANSDRWFVPTVQGGILLVVEKGYLDDALLDRVSADLQEAVEAVPRLTGRAPRRRGRFTVYVYDEGPLSESGVPGALPGEKGIMLRFVKEGADPLFHEMTHLLAGHGGSQSLNEGIADWVQSRLRPGRSTAFIPARTNPHAKARAALATYPPAFRGAIGAPGYHRWSGREIRFDFYYCSWSFTDFLLRQGDMGRFWSVLEAEAAPDAYLAAYGRTYEVLIDEWSQEVGGRAKTGLE
ncbi:MAG: hypothetical protein Q8T11_06840 [Elusimicrobiota bacterium]|nr:hypothetical protein [Elusimicrobiota bacterium]